MVIPFTVRPLSGPEGDAVYLLAQLDHGIGRVVAFAQAEIRVDETEWMSRDEIVDSTYEAGLRLNRLKARYGLVDPQQAEVTERRILKARRLIEQIDDVMSIADEGRRRKLLQALKPQVDGANVSTVCEKSELELPLGLLKLNLHKAALLVVGDLWARLWRRKGSIEVQS